MALRKTDRVSIQEEFLLPQTMQEAHSEICKLYPILRHQTRMKNLAGIRDEGLQPSAPSAVMPADVVVERLTTSTSDCRNILCLSHPEWDPITMPPECTETLAVPAKAMSWRIGLDWSIGGSYAWKIADELRRQ